MQPRLRAFFSAVRTKRIAASPDKTGMLLIARAISELPFAAYCIKNRRNVLGGNPENNYRRNVAMMPRFAMPRK
jgi:hypothetical protein